MEKLLAIDISETFVSGVLLETGGKAKVVHRYGVWSRDGKSLDDVLGELTGQLGTDVESCRVSVSSRNILFRNLNLPFHDRQKIEKILPLELDELTARPGSDLHYYFLVGENRAAGTPVLVAMMDRDVLAEILVALQTNDLDPELITVSGLPIIDDIVNRVEKSDSFLLVDIDSEKTVVFLVQNGRVGLIRPLAISGEDAGFSWNESTGALSVENPDRLADIASKLNSQIKQTMISVQGANMWEGQIPCYISGCVGLYPAMFEKLQQQFEIWVKGCDVAGQPLLKIEPFEGKVWQPGLMNRSLALGLAGKVGPDTLNFRSGDFRKPKSLKQMGRITLFIALPLAAVLLAASTYAWFDYSRLKSECETLRTRIRDTFHETLPEVTRVVQPVQQLKVKIDETRKLYSGGIQGGNHLRKVDLLAELSGRIPASLQVRFTRLVADEDDVSLKGETGDFNTVDSVQKELEKSDYFSSVTISSANLAPKGAGVRFELKLEIKR